MHLNLHKMIPINIKTLRTDEVCLNPLKITKEEERTNKLTKKRQKIKSE